MDSRRLVVLGFAVILALPLAFAQTSNSFTIGNANTRWTHSYLASAETGDINGRVSWQTELPTTSFGQMYQQWWWYRVEGESAREKALSTQTYFAYTASNRAVMRYTTSEGIVVDLVYTIVGSGIGTANAQMTIAYTVSNPTEVAKTVHLFYYQDCSLFENANNDEATVTAPDTIRAEDFGDTVAITHATPTPAAAEVNYFFDLRSKLTDSGIDDLDPASTAALGDEAGAFQWTMALGPSETSSGAVTITLTQHSPLLPTNFSLSAGDGALLNVRGLVGGSNGRLGTAGGSADLRTLGPETLDHLFRNWWYYRTNASTQEYGLSNLFSYDQPAGNRALLTYYEPTEFLYFDIEYILYDTGDDRAVLRMNYRVTNAAIFGQTVTVFNYNDADVSASLLDDFGSAVAPGHLRYTDAVTTAVVDHQTPTIPIGWQIGTYGEVNGLLTNTAIDDLTNSGAPVGPDDIASALAWQFELEPFGGTSSGTVFLTVNSEPVVDGDTNSDGCVDDADITNIILDYGDAPTGSNNTDLNQDGIVDDADLTEAILNYGNGC